VFFVLVYSFAMRSKKPPSAEQFAPAPAAENDSPEVK
jgi:hypothetical protein